MQGRTCGGGGGLAGQRRAGGDVWTSSSWRGRVGGDVPEGICRRRGFGGGCAGGDVPEGTCRRSHVTVTCRKGRAAGEEREGSQGTCERGRAGGDAWRRWHGPCLRGRAEGGGHAGEECRRGVRGRRRVGEDVRRGRARGESGTYRRGRAREGVTEETCIGGKGETCGCCMAQRLCVRDVRAHCVRCVATRAGPLGAWRC